MLGAQSFYNHASNDRHVTETTYFYTHGTFSFYLFCHKTIFTRPFSSFHDSLSGNQPIRQGNNTPNTVKQTHMVHAEELRITKYSNVLFLSTICKKRVRILHTQTRKTQPYYKRLRRVFKKVILCR